MFKQEIIGYIVNINMLKTISVISIFKFSHPLYKKVIKKIKRFLVHNDILDCQIGDKILITNIRPISKLKHFCILRILHRKLKKN